MSPLHPLMLFQLLPLLSPVLLLLFPLLRATTKDLVSQPATANILQGVGGGLCGFSAFIESSFLPPDALRKLLECLHRTHASISIAFDAIGGIASIKFAASAIQLMGYSAASVVGRLYNESACLHCVCLVMWRNLCVKSGENFLCFRSFTSIRTPSYVHQFLLREVRV